MKTSILTPRGKLHFAEFDFGTFGLEGDFPFAGGGVFPVVDEVAIDVDDDLVAPRFNGHGVPFAERAGGALARCHAEEERGGGLARILGVGAGEVEGHHLALNFTVPAGDAAPAMTPSFFGTNPGEVRQGNLSGLRVLGKEEDLGRELAKSLSEAQFKTALFDAVAPKEMITAAEKQVNPLKPEGLSDSEMNAEQKAKLREIIREYTDRVRPEIAAELWTEIDQNGPIAFAWAGTFAETEDGLPFFGSHEQHGPRVLFAMAYGGNGITYSLIGAEILRDQLLGKPHPCAALFGFGRLDR